MDAETTHQAKNRGCVELIQWLRSEVCYWEMVESLEKVISPEYWIRLTPMEVCFWTLVRCREELRGALLNDPTGVVAKSLRVLEHERIIFILEKAVEEQPWQADPHFVRFTTSVVASCLEACSRDQNRLPYHLKPSGS